jgi:hypothetical protein
LLNLIDINAKPKAAVEFFMNCLNFSLILCTEIKPVITYLKRTAAFLVKYDRVCCCFHFLKVGTRQTSDQLEIFGAFKGAAVVRGQDWNWDNQDGGLGAVGRVTCLADWNGQTARSVVSVVWPNKGENMYRLGHKVGNSAADTWLFS